MIQPDAGDRGFLMWAAAWLDGEGAIGMREITERRNYTTTVYRVAVSINQVTDAPLAIIRTAFGGSISINNKRQDRQRPIYQWNIHSKKAVDFLKAVRPYLMVKSQQADIAITAGEIVGRGIRGRWHKRSEAEREQLRQMKRAMNELNGWSVERCEKASVRSKGGGCLPSGKWSLKFDCCTNCGTTSLNHRARGLCLNCYGRYWSQHVKGRTARKPVSALPQASSPIPQYAH